MTPEQIRQEAERETYFKNQVAKEKGYPSWDEMFNSVCREDQYPSVAGILIESATKDAISRQLATKLEEKEKEIAELVGALKQIFEQYGYECKNYADSCGISFEKWVLDIPTYQTVKQILKKHNP